MLAIASARARLIHAILSKIEVVPFINCQSFGLCLSVCIYIGRLYGCVVVVLAPAELRRQSLPADTNLFIVLVELAFDMLKGFVPISVKMLALHLFFVLNRTINVHEDKTRFTDL